MVRRFTMLVERDPDSHWLVGEVVDLPGCYTQAPDINALEENMKEAIGAYLNVADDLLPTRIAACNIDIEPFF